MHRDASERARIGGKRAASAPASLSRTTAAMHTSFPSTAFIARRGTHRTGPLLPPSHLAPSLARLRHRNIWDYGKRKRRVGTDGRTDEGRPDADCQRGFTCSAFFRKAARSGEARRPRPRPGDAAAVAASNSIVWVGRRTHIFGAIEGLSFSSKLSSNVHLCHPENAIPRMHRTREGGLYLRNLTAHHTAKYASSLPLSRPELPKVK